MYVHILMYPQYPLLSTLTKVSRNIFLSLKPLEGVIPNGGYEMSLRRWLEENEVTPTNQTERADGAL